MSGVYTIDDFTLTTKLASNKAVESRIEKINASSINNILELSKFAIQDSPESYKDMVKDIKDYSARRKLYVDSQRITNACLLETSTSDTILKLLTNACDEYESANTYSQEIIPFADKVEDLWKEKEEEWLGKTKILRLHIDELNKYTKLKAGEMLIFGGYAKTGKSAMLECCGMHFLKEYENVLIIDSEQQDPLFFNRILAIISGVEFDKIDTGKMTEDELKKVLDAKIWLKSVNLTHEWVPSFDKNEIMSVFRRVNNKKKVTLLIIDYFKADYESQDSFMTATSLTGLLNFCKNKIGAYYKVPIIGALQTSELGSVSFSKSAVTIPSTYCLLSLKTQNEITQDGEDCGNAKLCVKHNRLGKQMFEDDYIDLQYHGDILTYEQAKKQHTKKTPY